ncbi:MAG TPA: YjiG family protein [Negativicutes bacterium]|nr:YjiG family protein [Negativicutes bacterium]
MSNKSLPDVFVEGARKGWNIGVSSVIPNVLMAFAIIQVFRITGLLTLLGTIFTPVMLLFGLPGEAIMVLISSWLSMGGGVGVAASLYNAGNLSNVHITILLPAIFLMGAQIQYMGRCLGTAGVQTRFYPVLFLISIINAAISMLLMRLFA